MSRVRYRIVESLPARVQSAAFCSLDPRQVRVHVSLDGDEVTIIATGSDPRVCERLLVALGADELGIELCG
jgi:hypothetical protein